MSPPTPDPFEVWLKTDFQTADGFDFPLPGKRASTVGATAHGRVAVAGDCGRPWGHVVMIDHMFYENHERRGVGYRWTHRRKDGFGDRTSERDAMGVLINGDDGKNQDGPAA